jgi:hypothetical protein
MLSNPVGIINPLSIGGGNYTLDLFFQAAGLAPYLAPGDTIKDANSNEYSVVTWSTFPSNFSSGGSVTVSFITADVLPNADAGFFSEVFTPNQVDVRSAVRTPGSLFNISLASGPDYEYNMEASWTINAEANNAQIGDSIVDSTGKEYQITFLEPTKFALPFKAAEVIKEAIPPAAGIATLYRPTINFELFQGTELFDPSRTVVRNRDDFNIDAALQNLQDQINNSGSGSDISFTATNNSGVTIVKGTPVTLDSSGDIKAVDVSIEDEALAVVGVTGETISNGVSGIIITAGKVTDITTTANFDDMVFISKTGALTNIKPDIGVDSFASGDFVISMGVISKNETNPANKDLIMNIQTIGQL